jgi:hypothetical protein
MRISLTRAGGVTGLTMAATLDTATLPAEEARSLESLVTGLDWSALQERSAPPPGARDLFEYELSVELAPGRREQVSLSEPRLPAAARPLIDALMARATPRA